MTDRVEKFLSQIMSSLCVLNGLLSNCVLPSAASEICRVCVDQPTPLLSRETGLDNAAHRPQMTKSGESNIPVLICGTAGLAPAADIAVVSMKESTRNPKPKNEEALSVRSISRNLWEKAKCRKRADLDQPPSQYLLYWD